MQLAISGMNTDVCAVGNSEVQPVIRGYDANDGDLRPKESDLPETSGVRYEIGSHPLSLGSTRPTVGTLTYYA
jgi:hypothetical protein